MALDHSLMITRLSLIHSLNLKHFTLSSPTKYYFCFKAFMRICLADSSEY